MSFFSGFMLGQTMSGRGNSGGAAVVLVGLFAFAFALLTVGAVLASLFGPFYGLVHFSMWASQEDFILAGVAVWMGLLPLILFAYLMAAFGTRNQLWIAAGGLSFLNWITFKTTHLVTNAPLSDWIEGLSPDEIMQMELGSAALCFGALVGLHYLLRWKVSAAFRARPFKLLKGRALSLYESKAASWIIFSACCLGLLGAAIHVGNAQDKIALAMSNGNKSFFEAFEFRIYVSFGRYILSVAVVFLCGVFAAANLVRLRKTNAQSGLSLSSD